MAREVKATLMTLLLRLPAESRCFSLSDEEVENEERKKREHNIAPSTALITRDCLNEVP